MKPTFKKTYECPETMVINTTSQPLIINIGSGNTTPEESDVNTSFFEDEENYDNPTFNVWDENF